MGGRQAKIYSSNKLLLDDIKSLFGIDNDVHQQTSQDIYDEKDAIISKKPLYFLTLGGKVFDYMMSSYKKSMPRKRSDQK